MKRKGFTPASRVQKDKIDREGLRFFDLDEDEATSLDSIVDPAHIIPRSMGGCEHEDCVLGLTRRQHRLYDEGKLSILEHLTLDEQAHAVEHLGILRALYRTTGERYTPEGK